MIVDFTPWSSLAGGLLIGLSATLLLASHGRIAGISGIWGGLLRMAPGETAWRGTFVAGLVSGGLLIALAWPDAIAAPSDRSLEAVALAGVLVGVGTRLGSGCTSGHGVCGLSRWSVRSMVAVPSFMIVGFVIATGMPRARGPACVSTWTAPSIRSRCRRRRPGTTASTSSSSCGPCPRSPRPLPVWTRRPRSGRGSADRGADRRECAPRSDRWTLVPGRRHRRRPRRRRHRHPRTATAWKRTSR